MQLAEARPPVVAGHAGVLPHRPNTGVAALGRSRRYARHIAAPFGTVVVCTRDRLALLPGCLDALERQEAGPGRFEVLVIDNGSTDGTAEWLAAWAAEEPARRRVAAEPEAGISRARNLAAELARGEILLFVDDDAVPDERWVEAHLARYADPRVGEVGGPVRLAWPDGRPSWLGPELEPWFSGIDLGPERREMPPPLHPFGANMSMRRAELLAAGGFALELGRKGRSLVSCEEFELAGRLWRRGVRVVWEPSAVVAHRIRADRLSRRWILRRGWAQGRSTARMDRRAGLPAGATAAAWTEARAAAGDLPALAGALRRGSSSRRLHEIALRLWRLAAAVEHLTLAVKRHPRGAIPAGEPASAEQPHRTAA